MKIKELGLPEGHPEKDGVLVDLKDLVSEIRTRLVRKEKSEDQDERGVEVGRMLEQVGLTGEKG